MLTTPNHVMEIDGHQLRFFTSPTYAINKTPDWPWHSADDLRDILRIPDEMAEVFRRKMKADWADEVRTVATPTGITMIAPLYMGEGMLKFMQYRRKILPTADRRRIAAKFRVGVTKSMMEMLKHLDPMQRMAVALSAER